MFGYLVVYPCFAAVGYVKKVYSHDQHTAHCNVSCIKKIAHFKEVTNTWLSGTAPLLKSSSFDMVNKTTNVL